MSPYFHKRIWATFPSSTTSATFQPQHRLLGCHGCHIRSSRRHAAHAAAAAEGTNQGSGPGDQRIENAIWTALLRAVQWRREGLEIMHPKFRCVFFRSPLFFFWFGYNFLRFLCRTPFLELVQPEFLQKSRVFQTFRTGFCFSQQPSLSITTISRVTFHLSSTSQAVRRLRSCSFPQKAGGTASRLSGKNVRLGRAEFLQPNGGRLSFVVHQIWLDLKWFEGSSSQNIRTS